MANGSLQLACQSKQCSTCSAQLRMLLPFLEAALQLARCWAK